MKHIFETIKAARWLELAIAAGLVCVLIVLALGGSNESAVSDEEARMQRILSKIEGAGRVSVMLARDDAGACTGAVVVASGAEDIEVMLRLQRAVQALTNLELGQIEIVR